MSFNEKLLTLRKNAGMSQDALADKLGVTRQAVSKWELGTAMPETKSIVQIAQVFSVTTDYLLGYTAVSYPDVKKRLKSNTNILIYIFYIVVTILFLFCSMKTVIHLARKIIWVVRGFAFLTWEEWLETGMSLGFDNGTYALAFCFMALALMAIKFLIRKFDEVRQK